MRFLICIFFHFFLLVGGYCQNLSAVEKVYSTIFDGSAIVSNPNSVYISGRTTANCLIVKTDSSLQPIWNIQLKRPSNGMIIKSLLLKDSNLFFTGFVKDTTQTNPSSNPNVIMLGSIDTASGQLINSRIIGDSLYSFNYSTIQTSDGNFLMAGQCNFDINIANPSSEGLIVKFDEFLNILWAKKYSIGQTTIFNDAVDISNNYFICGYTEDSVGSRDIVLLKTDAVGNTYWCKVIDGGYSETANSIISTNDTLLMSGEAVDMQGNVDGYVCAMDTSCNYYWNYIFHSNFPITKNKLLSFNSEYLIMTAGRTVAMFSFGGNLLNYNQTYRSYDDAIIQYPYLYTVNAGQLLLTRCDTAFNLCFPSPKSIQISPFIFTNIIYPQIESPFVYINLGQVFDSTYSIIDSTICQTYTGASEIASKISVRVDPNPAHDEITLDFGNDSNFLNISEIQIISVLGQRIDRYQYQIHSSDNSIKLNISGLIQGTYFLYNPNFGFISKFQKI